MAKVLDKELYDRLTIQPKRSKYGNCKTEVDGIPFDSAGEAKRYGELKLLERAETIGDLKLQQTFVLLEKQPGQRAIKYIADFTYLENGMLVAEDYKDFVPPAFVMKKKMFRVKFPNIELRLTGKQRKRGWSRK